MAYSSNIKHSYERLEKAAKGFASPSCEIKVAGNALKAEEYPIESLEVNIPVTVGTNASSIESSQCTFVVVGLYDAKNSKLKKNPFSKFEAGEKVEVSLGYQTRTTVFKGRICHVSVQFAEDGAIVQVSALDMSYILRGASQYRTISHKDPTQYVRTLLGSATFAPKDVPKVDTIKNFDREMFLEQQNVDDCTFLTMLARRSGFVFSFIHGDVQFCDMIGNNVPLITLKWGESLMSFHKETSTNMQVGGIEIHGKKTNTEQVVGRATQVKVKGKGRTAAEMDPNIKDKQIEMIEAVFNDQRALNDLAQAALNDIAIRFVEGSGKCIGLPELIPGRYIEIDGMGDGMDGTYFLSRVVHRFDTGGFVTTFEVKGAKS